MALVTVRNFRGPTAGLSEATPPADLTGSRAWVARVAALEAGLMRAACPRTPTTASG
jgi:hypothetical protein